MNVTISDVMDIIHPERKKVVNELPGKNNTEPTASNSTSIDSNKGSIGENKKDNEQKVKSDL